MNSVPPKVVGLLVLGYLLIVSLVGVDMLYKILLQLELIYRKGF